MSPNPSTAQQLAAVWSVALFGPDQVVELRAIGVADGYGRSFVSAGYFDADSRDKLAEAALQLTERAQGVYVTMNPLNPALLARRCNRVAKAEPGSLTKDKDVQVRRWLLIDADPIRVAGVSATDQEKEDAWAQALAVREYLRSRGWPDPILADSGNGFHLLYRIDLPADDGGLIERALAALANRFDTAAAKIDRAVHNPSRMCKLPYTWSRKGDGTPDRPHRQAMLLDVPPTGTVRDPFAEAASWKVDVVPVDLIEALAADGDATSAPIGPGPTPPPAVASVGTATNGRFRHRLHVDRWLADRAVSFRLKPEPDGKGRAVYALDACPFDVAHGPDAAVMQAPDGKLAAYCFHNGCAGRGWKDFKAKLGKPDPHHYDPPLPGKARKPPPVPRANLGGTRRPVEITTEEHRVNNEVIEELAKEDALYQRNGELVRVVVLQLDEDGPRVSAAPRIEAVPVPALRDTISRRVEFFRTVVTDDEEAAELKHPPAWCVSAVSARGEWPAVRQLTGVVPFPVLRPDGSILVTPGYDPATGLFLHWVADPLEVPDRPTRDDARRAATHLLDVVSDFPFQADMHRGAWLGGLLTPLAKPAFDGPAPLFLVDANVRAAGKGMLLEVLSRIVTGNPFPVLSYPAGSKDGEEELRKKITTFLMYGDRMVLLDNLTGGFGDGTLDRCLTATEWQDRQLGANRQFRGPIDVTFYATGNNVEVRADTARRICHIRLESPEERPEERSDFRRPHLISWVLDNRTRLLTGALTILRAYHVAGRPDHGLKPWGSFESWSRLVRNAVVWCGLTDPGETRQVVQEKADETGRGLRQLLAALEFVDPDRRGLTAAEIVRRATDEDTRMSSEVREMLVSALDALVSKPDGRKLGYRLRHLRRRVVDGRFLDLAGQDGGVNRWIVRSSKEFAGEAVSCPPSPACPSDDTCGLKDIEGMQDMVPAGPEPNLVGHTRDSLYQDQRLPD
jgi:hypothetical protein